MVIGYISKIEHTWITRTTWLTRQNLVVDWTGAECRWSLLIRVVKSRDPEGALGAPLCHRKILPLHSGETASQPPSTRTNHWSTSPIRRYTKTSSKGSQRKPVYLFKGARVQIQIIVGDLMQRFKEPMIIHKRIKKNNNKNNFGVNKILDVSIFEIRFSFFLVS